MGRTQQRIGWHHMGRVGQLSNGTNASETGAHSMWQRGHQSLAQDMGAHLLLHAGEQAGGLAAGGAAGCRTH